ncbi:MAG: XRE family transcriptional regulator [Pararhizobium sp.]
MIRTLDEQLARLPAERRAKIEAEAARLAEEYATLKDLRRAREMTQAALAETLHVNQVSIAKLEKRSDLLLSTLRNYVQAMGGELELVVKFPGKAPIRLQGISEVAQPRE